MEPWGKKVYFGTAGAAVYIVDPKTGEYRESVSQDAYDIARLVDQMEHIHFYQRTVVLAICQIRPKWISTLAI